MAYTITKTDGNVLFTVADGDINTTTSLSIPGGNYVGYGEQLDNNLIHLLENFAGTSFPGGTSLEGQLCYRKDTKTLHVFTGSQGYLPVNGLIVAGSQPANAIPGNTWFNNTTEQYFFYDGTKWSLIGPTYTKNQGESGTIPVNVGDAVVVGNTHNILKLQYGNFVYAILSSDSPGTGFVPSPAIPGFPTIYPGITISNLITGAQINTNVVGNLTGDVTGNLTGTTVTALVLYGNLVGNVTATTVTATTVTATNLNGSLTGNFNSTNGVATNFSTGNAQITGGYTRGLTDSSVTTQQATNFSTGNAQITGGAVTGLTNLSATTAQATNLSSANVQATSLTATNLVATTLNTGIAQITGGYAKTLTNVYATLGQFVNFSTGNAQITGGNVNGVGTISATTGAFTNITTGTISVTGGSLTGLTTTTATNTQTTNFSTGNAQITGGAITNTPILGSTGNFTTAVATNFSSGNAQITGGSANNLDSLSATLGTLTTAISTNGSTTTLVARNFSSGNAVISGGNLDGAIVGGINPNAGTFTTLGVKSTSPSTSTTTGALTVGGGLGVAGSVFANQFNGSGAGLTGSAPNLSVNYATSAGNGGVTSVNGSTGAITVRGLGLGGETWHDVTGSRSQGVTYYNTHGYPIQVQGNFGCNGGGQGYIYIDGTLISHWAAQFNGCGGFSVNMPCIVPPGSSYMLANMGGGAQGWYELY